MGSSWTREGRETTTRYQILKKRRTWQRRSEEVMERRNKLFRTIVRRHNILCGGLWWISRKEKSFFCKTRATKGCMRQSSGIREKRREWRASIVKNWKITTSLIVAEWEKKEMMSKDWEIHWLLPFLSNAHVIKRVINASNSHAQGCCCCLSPTDTPSFPFSFSFQNKDIVSHFVISDS